MVGSGPNPACFRRKDLKPDPVWDQERMFRFRNSGPRIVVTLKMAFLFLHFNALVIAANVVTGGGEVKKIPPTASNNHSKDSSNKPAKNGPAPAPNNSDIRPAKSKADAVDTAPVRPSKQQQQQQQQHQQPQKEKQQSQAATAVEDFPTLGTVTF